MVDAFDLTSRKAVVTGAGGGLGRAMAIGLAEAGADAALMGRSSNIESVADGIRGLGRQAFTVSADLRDRQALRRGFNLAVEGLGGIDILVTAHGTAHVRDALSHDLESWDETLEVNLTSVFELCCLASARMVEQGGGKIINVASMLSFSGGLRVAAYAASKGGVAQLTKALANEWAARGVNVNAVAPGYVRTNLNAHIWGDPARSAQILARLPAGRWGEPEDVKGVVVFLASPASDYVHGAIIPVDGGWLAR